MRELTMGEEIDMKAQMFTYYISTGNGGWRYAVEVAPYETREADGFLSPQEALNAALELSNSILFRIIKNMSVQVSDKRSAEEANSCDSTSV